MNLVKTTILDTKFKLRKAKSTVKRRVIKRRKKQRKRPQLKHKKRPLRT